MQTIDVLLFDDFTALDALGPCEALGRLKDNYELRFISEQGGSVRGSTGIRLETESADIVQKDEILLLPGGFGTRKLVGDPGFLSLLKRLADSSEYVLSVCTGSALLAAAGALNGRRATSNKLAWDWVTSQGPVSVQWIRAARWVVDGKYYSSSGVSAGIDMALGFIADRQGLEAARRVSASLEYLWNEDPELDPFA